MSKVLMNFSVTSHAATASDALEELQQGRLSHSFRGSLHLKEEGHLLHFWSEYKMVVCNLLKMMLKKIKSKPGEEVVQRVTRRTDINVQCYSMKVRC